MIVSRKLFHALPSFLKTFQNLTFRETERLILYQLRRLALKSCLVSGRKTAVKKNISNGFYLQGPSLSTLSAYAAAVKRLPKGNLTTMEISKDVLQKIITPEVSTLVSLFDKYDYEIRMAGGAVRDIIGGKIPADIDFATTATPTEMKSMFEKEGIRMINSKGEDHGTITARINDKENFEVTTLRIDVVTDGRHAQVEFTKDWELDAARRDLTINSMFMDFQGKVYDYFNGIEDLKNKRVRFVGNPSERIQEDYLRILRYFRFYGRIATSPNLHETNSLSAIKENVNGLSHVSGERIWVELKKILTGNFFYDLMLKMIELGIAPHIGLPKSLNLTEFELVCKNLQMSEDYNPVTPITGLIYNDTDVTELCKRLRFSTFEKELCNFLVLYRNTLGKESSTKSFQRLVILSKSKQTHMRSWVEEVYKYNGNFELLDHFQHWETPNFPISGRDLIQLQVPRDKVLGRVLENLKELWIESDYKLTSEELLNEVPKILELVPRAR